MTEKQVLKKRIKKIEKDIEKNSMAFIKNIKNTCLVCSKCPPVSELIPDRSGRLKPRKGHINCKGCKERKEKAWTVNQKFQKI